MTIVTRPTPGKPCSARRMHSFSMNVCVDLMVRMRGIKSRMRSAGVPALRPKSKKYAVSNLHIFLVFFCFVDFEP